MPPKPARSITQPMDSQDVRIEKLERQVETLTHQISILNSKFSSPAHNNDYANHELRGMGLQQNCDSRISQLYNYDDAIEVPEFRGSGGDDFPEWSREVERISELANVPHDKMVKLVAIKLKGLASAWWKHLTLKRERSGKSTITSWEEMKEEMTENFLPINYCYVLYQRLCDLRQGDLSVDDYTEEFYNLVNKNECMDERLLVIMYKDGLRPEIQAVLELHSSRTMSDAYKKALALEQQERRDYIQSDKVADRYQSGQSIANWEGEDRDFHGRNFGREDKGKEKSIRYFKCNKIGHIASECRKCILNKAEGSIQVTDDEEIPGEAAKHAVGEMVGEGNEEGDIYQTGGDVFRTRCTVNGRVCKVIISGSCCENIISQEAVDKLQLKVEKLPAPYQLSWIISDRVITISSRCQVSFSIGKTYHDTVSCEVVDIKVCHMILGRPWQYDRKTCYNGRDNTYTFWKDNKKIVLVPMKNKVDSQMDSNVCFLPFFQKKHTS